MRKILLWSLMIGFGLSSNILAQTQPRAQQAQRPPLTEEQRQRLRAQAEFRRQQALQAQQEQLPVRQEQLPVRQEQVLAQREQVQVRQKQQVARQPARRQATPQLKHRWSISVAFLEQNGPFREFAVLTDNIWYAVQFPVWGVNGVSFGVSFSGAY
ncbi:MAG: hypothetical protein ACRCY4_10175, partial [Brevinema sp.]